MMHMMNRRDVLRSLGVLFLPFIPARWTRAESAAEDFRFVAINDLHYQDEACTPWFAAVVESVKKLSPAPDFCLLCGDLTELATPEEMAGIRDVFGKLGIPVYAVPGNHDNDFKGGRTVYDKFFPGQTNQYFKHKGWQIIGLDTTEARKWNETTIAQSTLDWLDGALKELDAGKPTIVFTHFPLGEGVKHRPLNADSLLGRFKTWNLQAAFSGHWHGYSERVSGAATLTTGRCCARLRANHDGSKQKGWFLCEATGGRVTRTFVETNG